MDWKYRLNIKQHISSDISPQAIRRCYNGIDKELRRLPSAIRKSGDLPDIMEELKDAAEEGNLTWFNSALSCLYDWADEEQVWLGIIE